MFSYCLNNPVINIDSIGSLPIENDQIGSHYMGYGSAWNWLYHYQLDKYKDTVSGTTAKGITTISNQDFLDISQKEKIIFRQESIALVNLNFTCTSGDKHPDTLMAMETKYE